MQATDVMGVISQFDDVNQSCGEFIKILSNAVDKFTTVSTGRIDKRKHKMSPWITRGIIRSIRFRDRLFKRYRQSAPGSVLHNQLKTNVDSFNKILKKTIRAAKRQHYFHSFQQHENDPNNTWRTINSVLSREKSNDDLPSFLTVDGQKIEDKKEMVNLFNKHFASIGEKLSNSIENCDASFGDYLRNESEQRFDFQFVTRQQVEDVIKKLKNKTSCSSDGVSSKLLKHLKEVVSEPITFLINQTFRSGCFPDVLKLARVKSLFKKGDVHDPNNYRPISILPAVSKVFEKIIQKQIVNFFDSNNLFFGSQYGFRSKHSTELAVLELIDRINLNMDKGEIPITIFIDLSKAFD